jgi:hypothetical protein
VYVTQDFNFILGVCTYVMVEIDHTKFMYVYLHVFKV